MSLQESAQGAPPSEDGRGALPVPGRRPIWVLIGVTLAVATALHLRLVPLATDLGADDWLGFVLVALGFAGIEILSVHLQDGRQTHSLSVSELPPPAGLILLDPFLLVAARLLGTIPVLVFHRRQPGIKIAFNTAAWWLETVVAVGLWHLFLGTHDVALDRVTEPRGWFALIGTVMITSVLNGVLISAAISLSQRRLSATSVRVVLITLVSAIANASFVLVAAMVLSVDWRAAWTLFGIAVGFLLAYRAYTALQSRHQSLEQLAAFSRTIGHDLHAEAVALSVLSEVRTLLQVDVAELVLEDPEAGALRLVRDQDDQLQVHRNSEGSLAATFIPAGWSGRPILIPRHTKDPVLRESLGVIGRKDALVVSLQEDGVVIGSLLVADRVGDVGTFDEHEATLLTALANHASIALKNGSLADRLRREATEKEHQSLHDALTGLPNRTLFHARVRQVVAAGDNLAVLLMDLDRFKEINDTLGHHTGDQLLVEIARRLRTSLPPEAVVARLGGDEFVICLPNAGLAEATALSETLRLALGRPVDVDGLSIEVEASVGAALAPQHGKDPSSLLQHADVAMYAAKGMRSGFEVYAADRDQYSPQRLTLVTELRRAIEGGELVNYYQPKVALDTGAVVGVEALVRWAHPRHGLIPPDEFVHVAEQTGLVRPLTLVVLEEALRCCAGWRAQGLDLGVAVNLSPRSLLDFTLVDDVEALLDQFGVPHGVLTLEITESCMMADPTGTTALLKRLSAVGAQLSVDDFGTGYSSLAYLKRLPVDEIKIDKSFVQTMRGDESDAAIIAAIVELSHRLGKRVVAEGVEDQESYEQLARLGCDTAQGYWLSRPLTAPALETWMAERAAAMEMVTPLHRPRPAPAVVLPRL
jgi:diguanylate cyclase (GGDEF)-like protein